MIILTFILMLLMTKGRGRGRGRLKVDQEKDIMNVSVEMEEIVDFYS